MQNILTPLDMIGSMVTPRFEGEPLSVYRNRVLQVAGVIAKRDGSERTWLEEREQELSGRTGYSVKLFPGANDPELLDQAEKSLFTYNSLADWEGLFTWPEKSVSGEFTLYNRVGPTGSGVASANDLRPVFDKDTGRYHLTPGYIIVDSCVWYIPADLKRLRFDLPDNTTQTVIIPYQIFTDHPHRIDIIDRQTLQLVADDHTHDIQLLEEGWVFIDYTDLGGGPAEHDHDMHKINADGGVFLASTKRNPEVNINAYAGQNGSTIQGITRKTSIDGMLGVPILNLLGEEITTTDGLHTAWIDPYAYWSGDFTIGDSDHIHEVINYAVQNAGLNNHSHVIPTPTPPMERLLVPVLVEDEEQVYEVISDNNPYIAQVKIDRGWTVIKNGQGLGESIIAAYDVGDLIDIPVRETPKSYSIGIGPEVGASQVFVTLVSPEVVSPGQNLDIKIRLEDQYTGGIPNGTVYANLYTINSSGLKTRTTFTTSPQVTDLNGETILYVATPTGSYDTIELEFMTPDIDNLETNISVGTFTINVV